MTTKTTIFVVGFAFLLTTSFTTAQNNTTNYGNNSGTTGDNNSFFGNRSGRLTTANNNSFFGNNSGSSLTTGTTNSFFGSNSGRNNVEGSSNTFIGNNSGRENNGNRNVFIGNNSGRNNAEGNGNIFIGHRSGFNETANNRLYIDNSDTDTPLIYGKFAANQVGINTTNLSNDITFAVGGNTAIDGSISTTGKISIGTTVDDPEYDFTVKGKIHVQEVKVDLLGAIAPDYVFYDSYKLKTLKEVEDYITKNGHLPNIPSAKEMEEKGVNLKEMNLLLLEKIEELTLYSISQKKDLDQQKSANQALEKRLDKLEKILAKE